MADQAPSAQRRWRAPCPNCGAPVEFASAASASAVCGFCRSTLLRDGETLSQIGPNGQFSAEIFDDYSPLQLGATGRWLGTGFAVIGRVQRGSPEGNWNEWHLLFDAGAGPPRVAWLSEDNGQFVLSLEAPLADALPPRYDIGAPLTLAGQRWQVSAIVPATLRAAEGELPRPPRAGTVIELRNAAGEVGSLEFQDGVQPPQPIWSVGRAVRLAELALQGLRVTAEGESVAEAKFAGRSLACPSCGAPLAPKLSAAKSMTCGQCQAVVDLAADDAKALGFTPQSPGLDPQIPLGRTGSLSLDGGPPQPWQVVGYQERCDLPESGEDEQSFWREYLLFNRLAGFAFLVDTREGWSLVRTLTGAPTPGANASVSWQGRVYAQRWAYTAKTTHVLGEFYWPVRLEDRVQVADFASADGQALLSREQTATEVSWSGGAPLNAEDVRRAFRLAPAAALARDASAFKTSGSSLLFKLVVGLFLLVVLLALVRGCAGDDCQGFKDSFGENSAEYAQCRSNARSGVYLGTGRSGGSYGGYSSGGGGHK